MIGALEILLRGGNVTAVADAVQRLARNLDLVEMGRCGLIPPGRSSGALALTPYSWFIRGGVWRDVVWLPLAVSTLVLTLCSCFGRVGGMWFGSL